MRNFSVLNMAFGVFLNLLAGCANNDELEGFALRNGPSPILKASDVSNAGKNRDEIMKALEEHTNQRTKGMINYYDITVTGFNFVDEQCDAYLSELYHLDHQRDRAKAFINSAGTLTEAILGAVPASKVSLGVVAQAFNLSTALVDNLTNSYLFQNHSADIIKIVEMMQVEYRNNIAKNSSSIDSEPQAYSTIRGYLRLCLPVSIEANISSGLGKLKAQTAPLTAGPAVKVNLVAE